MRGVKDRTPHPLARTFLRQVDAILAGDRLDDEVIDDSKCERIEGSIPEVGWQEVLASVLGIRTAQGVGPTW